MYMGQSVLESCTKMAYPRVGQIPMFESVYPFGAQGRTYSYKSTALLLLRIAKHWYARDKVTELAKR